MPRGPMVSPAHPALTSGTGRHVLPEVDPMHGSRVIPHRARRRSPSSNARTPHVALRRRQIVTTPCATKRFLTRSARVSLISSQARTVWMDSSSAQVLDAFLRRYPPEAPSRPSDLPHEDLRLARQHGFRILLPAPATGIRIGTPPTSRFDSRCRYLWVIDDRGIPYVIEERLDVLNANLPKHTNLTGGGKACMGGEMWFVSDTTLYVSGGSGRYPAADLQQLEAAVGVFESLGYGVTSLGWDHAVGRPSRYWNGEIRHG